MVIGALALFFGGVDRWEVWAAVYILPGVFIAVWNVRKLLWRSRKPLAGLWSTLRGNKNYMLASVSVIATTRFERLLLPILANPRELGLYIVVATASEPLFWFAQALSDIRVGAGKASAFSRRAFAIDILLFGSVGAIGGVAINYLLVPVFGEAYEESRALIAPLILASIILALYRQLSGKVLLGRSSRAFAASEVVTGIQAVIVYSCFLLVFPSALGAAWGSVAVYSIAIVVLAIFGFRKPST
ncbi:hypothetical protein [Dietzia lutea]|uniref:hypothetical protein n=1 Tax=Dietzia lutea TaxID=546160 RepID=UPI0013300174|nr:hypothetical protein [Dietzia lutea]